MGGTEPIRVAQIVGKALFAGVDSVVMNHYRALPKERVQFDFFLDSASVQAIDDEIVSMGGRVYRILSCKRDMLGSMLRTARLLRQGNYKIVHCHLNSLSVFFLCAARLAGVPVRIAHSHSTASPSEGLRAAVKYVLRPFSKLFATRYAACSEHAGSWLFGERAVQSGLVRILPNAICISQYDWNPRLREEMRQQWGLSDKLVVGHVGRFEHQKNHKFLLKVFAQIRQLRPDAVLLLIGEGSRKAQMQRLALRLGLADAVLFLGLRRDVGALLQAMDAFVLPSFFEGLSVAAIEAQAAGLPVWASAHVPSQTNVTGKMHFLSLKSPASAWAKSIVEAMPCDRSGGKEALIRAGYEHTQAAGLLASWYEELHP